MTSRDAASEQPHRALSDEWDDNPVAGPSEQTEADSDGGGGEPPALYFPTLNAFVAWLGQVYRRSMLGPGRTWCPEWWEHPEAIARLGALWRAFEALRLEPGTGMSTWWLSHADPQMRVLMDPHGPLQGCSPDKGHTQYPPEALTGAEPPVAFSRHQHAPVNRPVPPAAGTPPSALDVDTGRNPWAAPGPGRSAARATPVAHSEPVTTHATANRAVQPSASR